MKKITNLFVFGLLIAMTTLPSCIDNEVAPEVTRIREAQASYLEAQARLQEALAMQEEIQTAMDSISLLADIAELQTFLQEEELRLQEAIDELAEYLAEHGLDQAALYLADYSDAMGNVYDSNADILDQIAYIANLNQLIESGSGDSYALLTEFYQRDVDQSTTELAYLEELLVIYEGIAGDPSTTQAALDAANTEYAQGLVNADQLSSDYVEATLVVDQLTDDKDYAEQAIEEYEDAQDNLEAAVEAEGVAQENIDAATAAIADLNTQLTPYSDALAAVTGPYNSALATAKGLLNTYFNAEAVLNADPGNASKITARDNARTAFVDNAGDYIATYGYTNAIDIKNNNALENEAGIAATDFGDAKIDYDAEAVNFEPGGAALALEVDIEVQELLLFNDQGDNDPSNDTGYQEDLADAIADQAEYQADITRLQSAYDDAIANIDGIRASLLTAQDQQDDIDLELDILDDRLSNLEDLIDNLDDLLDDSGNLASIQDEIDNLTDDIENAKQNLEDAQENLADNQIDLEEAQAIIANEEGYLAQLQEELAGWEALAAEYLALFNAALAG